MSLMDLTGEILVKSVAPSIYINLLRSISWRGTHILHLYRELTNAGSNETIAYQFVSGSSRSR